MEISFLGAVFRGGKRRTRCSCAAHVTFSVMQCDVLCAAMRCEAPRCGVTVCPLQACSSSSPSSAMRKFMHLLHACCYAYYMSSCTWPPYGQQASSTLANKPWNSRRSISDYAAARSKPNPQQVLKCPKHFICTKNANARRIQKHKMHQAPGIKNIL